MRNNGLVEEWFKDADPAVRKITAGVNGQLLEQLLRVLKYHDVACVELLRRGRPLPLLHYVLSLLRVLQALP